MNTYRSYKCPLEWKSLVYCSKCGAKNEDDAQVCVGCGASLYVPKHKAKHKGNECFGPKEEKRFEDECFGLPYGGAIIGIIFGIIILTLGFAWLANINIWDYLGPLFVIIIGVLIIAGVAYGATRR